MKILSMEIQNVDYVRHRMPLKANKTRMALRFALSEENFVAKWNFESMDFEKTLEHERLRKSSGHQNMQ